MADERYVFNMIGIEIKLLSMQRQTAVTVVSGSAKPCASYCRRIHVRHECYWRIRHDLVLREYYQLDWFPSDTSLEVDYQGIGSCENVIMWQEEGDSCQEYKYRRMWMDLRWSILVLENDVALHMLVQ